MKFLPFDHAIRNLGRSPKRLALVVAGSALVSFLLLGAVAFARGMESALAATGLATNALVLGAGSEESVERSEISPTTAEALAADIDGLAQVAGEPAVSPEIHLALPVSPLGRGAELDAPPVLVRGFESMAFAVHPQVRLAEGRWPARGADEIAAGIEAIAKVQGASLGSTVLVAGEPFEIVGVLAAPGTAMHGEFWMRLDRLALLTQRTTHSCVVAALGDADFDDIDAFTAMRLDLETVAMRESDYYARLTEFFAPIRMLVLVTAILISTGGVLGGVHAMYAAFASRVREAGTLQAIGFSRAAIAVSLTIESTVACVAGALLAAAAGLLFLDGLAIRFSMGSFGLSVDGPAVLAGLSAGVLLGLLGAVPAILRCLTLPIPSALRS
ncbi:MAG: FtsX-like permease family protein [Phycisphaera sp.]|nr:FtsX-like permease family protein [Phycisphaera sp.]